MICSKNSPKELKYTLTYEDFLKHNLGVKCIYDLPESESESKKRYEKYEHLDPFYEIPPALLNSVDFANYVSKTGILYPFYPVDDFLKTASYAVRMLGRITYWDISNEYTNSFSYDNCLSYLNRVDCNTVDLKLGDEFKLRPNSIAFVELEPTFRLPSYIAIRFNLTISHVYKGLLLGTGPLIDPGFCGKIYIPLHNLTTNEYTFRGGEDLIWVEFTKLSPHSSWKKEGEYGYKATDAKLAEFKKDRRYMPLSCYLDRGPGLRPVLSSMGPFELELKKIQSLKRIINIGIIALGIALLTLIAAALPMYSELKNTDTQLSKDNMELSSEITTLQKNIDKQQAIIDKLQEQLKANEKN